MLNVIKHQHLVWLPTVYISTPNSLYAMSQNYHAFWILRAKPKANHFVTQCQWDFFLMYIFLVGSITSMGMVIRCEESLFMLYPV